MANAWYTDYELTKEWFELNPGKNLSLDIVYKNRKIGAWYNHERCVYLKGEVIENGSLKYKKHYMSVLKQEMFGKLIPDETTEYITWKESYELTNEWSLKNPGKKLCEKQEYRGYKIGLWYAVQKNIYFNGKVMDDGSIVYKHQKMTLEKRTLFEKLLKKINKNTLWNEKFSLLKEWIELNPECELTSNTVYKHENIGRWFYTQVFIFKHGILNEDGVLEERRRKLTMEQVEKIESLGFPWYKNIGKLMKTEITSQNKFQIEREILRNFKKDLELCKNINEVNGDVFLNDSKKKRKRG